jgi:4-hydroxyphenylacetate 3-monooxygenase
MLKTGAEHLETLVDGRKVYVGSELVDDVTTHPHFAGGARTVAAIYDRKAAAEDAELLTYEEDGERFSSYWLRPKSRDDLYKRTMTHKAIADVTFGLFGRSPDHVGGLLTGLAMKPDVLESDRRDYAGNFLQYWDSLRRSDSYPVFAAIPPAGIRAQNFGQDEGRRDPGLKVVREDDQGVVISGMKMMATAAAYANEILISNFIPLAPEFGEYSITCAIPCNAPGLALWSRQPYAAGIRFEVDYPLSYSFDEGDCVIVCDEVKVPWERVFVHDNTELSRGCWITSPANCFSNHQSNVRFWSKMSLLVGLASLVTEVSGNDKIPAVQETLGKLAAYEATIAGMVHGQVQGCEMDWPGGDDGFVCYNRRFMYGALNWCQENHTAIIDIIRELAGGNPLLMPADSSALGDADLREVFENNFHTPYSNASDRLRLMKIVWDLTGSEFAGRHQLYEKFYAGAPFVVRNQSFREAPWDAYRGLVTRLMEDLAVPAAHPRAAE